ncbi:hypothetical protein ACM9XA_03360 [Xanthomonas sacchari]
MANIKYADPSYTDTNATDDDRVMLRTGAGADARAPLVQPKGYIDGLRMVWVSSTQMQITAGAAYIPGPKRIVELPAAVTKTPALTASTWYHMYLYLNGTTPDIEVTTTAPGAFYSGTARTKTGDTSRRYIGSVRTDSSAALIRFFHDGRLMRWLEGNFTTFRVVSNGTATSQTSASLSVGVPMSSTGAFIRATNTAPSGQPGVVLGAYGVLTYPVQSGNYSAYLEMPCNADQTIRYAYDSAPSGGGLYVDIFGYLLDR